jgi:alpha-D-ribose 1-methylphosphonate 5-phosphate C-P lyase
VQTWDKPCELCGSRLSYLDEVIVDDQGSRLFVCSDTDYCEEQRQANASEGAGA